jgi:hypothetical protein
VPITPSGPDAKHALEVGQDTAVALPTCIDPGMVLVTEVEPIEMPADHDVPFQINAAPESPLPDHEYMPVAAHDVVDTHERPVIEPQFPLTGVDHVPLDSSYIVP